MAGEDRAYSAWVRKQPCRACFGPGPCEQHHSTNGSNASPERPLPAKALGGRRGVGQKAHDHESFALHTKCHRQFHDSKGQFAGWTLEQKRAWQDKQVAASRAEYEQHLKLNPPPATAKGRAKYSESIPAAAAGDPLTVAWLTGANAERREIVEWLKRRAADRRLLPEAYNEISDLADLLEDRREPMAKAPARVG